MIQMKKTSRDMKLQALASTVSNDEELTRIAKFDPNWSHEYDPETQ
jgi:hypothetical protein